MVVTSQVLAAGRISVQWKPEWTSLGLKTDESLIRTICGSEFQTRVLKIGKHAWKSLSWWRVGPAAGWQMNVRLQTRCVIQLCI